MIGKSLILITALLLCGCSAIQHEVDNYRNGYFSDNLLTKEQSQKIAAYYLVKLTPSDPDYTQENASVILSDGFEKKYNSAGNNKKTLRNVMIDDLISLSNYRYQNYVKRLTFSQNSVEFSANFFATAVSGVGALATGGSTPNILSGISAFITGTKDSYQEIMFGNKAIEAIINSMTAERNKLQLEILKKKVKSADDYPVSTVLREILDMHNSGDVMVALNKILQDTSEEVKNSKANLAAEKKK